ncbi:MAG: acyltransferase [Lachnospiraceae bacterium]
MNEGKTITRNTTIDIIKGICIILMVWGHAAGPFKHWIYLFHMAVFFIASGVLWDDMRVIDLHKCKVFVLKKIKSLWLPFVLCNALFNLIHNFLLETGIYSDNPQFLKMVTGPNNYLQPYRTVSATCKEIIKNLLFAGGSQLGGATWFLRTLFQVLLVYMVIIYISRKFNSRKIMLCISGFICITGATIVSIYNLRLPLGIHSFFAAFAVFQTGVFVHNACLDKRFSRHKYKVIVISFLLLCLLNRYGKVNMSSGNITNIVFFLAVSITGWVLLYSIASCKSIRENKLLIYIGQHTLSIMVLHLLAFKIVTWIYILISNRDVLLLAAFPVISKVPYLWAFYTLCGVAVPLFAEAVFLKFKKAFLNNS